MKGTARVFLELRIGKRVNIYRLMPLNPDPSVATKAWRLFKSASKFYDVAINSKGWITCTCADATFRLLRGLRGMLRGLR